jgi:sec-independent protein translocase protein TatC
MVRSLTNQKVNQSNDAPLLDHLEELRIRIIWSVVIWALASVASWFLVEPISIAMRGLLSGYEGSSGKVNFVFTGLTDKLSASFQIALFAGLVLAMPGIVWQLWSFIAPGLTRAERRFGSPFVIFLGVMFAVGVAFAYFVVLPYAIPFLLGFGPFAEITNQIPLPSYILSISLYLLVFGLVFELPMVMYLLGRFGLMTASFLSAYRRHAIMAIITISAVITPTIDPVNLAFMAIPLWVLFEFGIVLVRIAQHGRGRELEPT